jgi:hypothetical protein
LNSRQAFTRESRGSPAEHLTDVTRFAPGKAWQCSFYEEIDAKLTVGKLHSGETGKDVKWQQLHGSGIYIARIAGWRNNFLRALPKKIRARWGLT